MNDSWGDGWNGGYITAYENNISIGTYSVSENSGTSETASVCISDGSSFLLQYTQEREKKKTAIRFCLQMALRLSLDGLYPTSGDVYGTYLLWSSQTSCVVKPTLHPVPIVMTL